MPKLEICLLSEDALLWHPSYFECGSQGICFNHADCLKELQKFFTENIYCACNQPWIQERDRDLPWVHLQACWWYDEVGRNTKTPPWQFLPQQLHSVKPKCDRPSITPTKRFKPCKDYGESGKAQSHCLSTCQICKTRRSALQCSLARTLLFLYVTVKSTLNGGNAVVMCSISMTLAACLHQHPEAALPPKTALKAPTDSIWLITASVLGVTPTCLDIFPIVSMAFCHTLSWKI